MAVNITRLSSFIKWVQDYKKWVVLIVILMSWANGLSRFYYQYSPNCLSTCPVTIHALLHITDSIEAVGPMWACYCSFLAPVIRSWRFQFTELTQLTQIKMIHQLHGAISLKLSRHDIAGQFSTPDCELLSCQVMKMNFDIICFQIQPAYCCLYANPVFITDEDSSWQCPPSSLLKQFIHQAPKHLCCVSPWSPTGYSTFIHIFSSSIVTHHTFLHLLVMCCYSLPSSYLIWSFTFDLFALVPYTPTYTDS